VITTSFHFDREHLAAVSKVHREGYGKARPFPHAVMDDLLPVAFADQVLDEFPAPDRGIWWEFDSERERKLATKDESSMGEATRHLFAEFNSAAFIDFLEELTGIEGLVPDPHLSGGGLHQIRCGGHLSIHADFNRHPRTDLERRLNVLFYLNRDWEESYGGALELWSEDMRACEARILPLFNRCVVFSTGDTSFHGHPDPLTCPPERTRKSMALYYYTRNPAHHGSEDVHNTLFRLRPEEHDPGDGPTARSRAKDIARRLAPPVAVDTARWLRRRMRASDRSVTPR
jgi:hypothetical protein